MILLVDNRTVSDDKHKPAADEQTLAKLLEAAFVLQEHNREMERLQVRLGLKRVSIEAENHSSRQQDQSLPAMGPKSAAQAKSPTPSADYRSTLGRIVEIQHQIQVRTLDFKSALKLVAQRVCELTHATGAAIGIIEQGSVFYRAVTGSNTPEESLVPLDQSILARCIETGEAFRCADASVASQPDAEKWRRRGIQSLIVVPFFHNGGIAGSLELYNTSPNAFMEQDVHTCQLMAGLVGEALVREEEGTSKKSLAAERAAMLEALEKLQPNLAALVDPAGARTGLGAPLATTRDTSYSCRKCGHRLMREEQFCGQCGLPRAGDYEPSNIQSKVASLWQMQQSQTKVGGLESAARSMNGAAEKPDPLRWESPIARSVEQQVPDPFTPEDLEFSENPQIEASIPAEIKPIPCVEDEQFTLEEEDSFSPEPRESSRALVKSDVAQSAAWNSAASTRPFLERLASNQRGGILPRFWNTRRGDIYLGIAVILVACVVRWGLWSSPSVKATVTPAKPASTQHKPAPEPGLSFLDRVLIQLGLAEAPEPVPDKGNPSAQVWVDLQTALYYCPGSDQYGKTSRGKFTSQREAQLDQFEPAYRRVCK